MHVSPFRNWVYSLTHLMPSIVWRHIQAVVVAKFCRIEEESSQTRTKPRPWNGLHQFCKRCECLLVCSSQLGLVLHRLTLGWWASRHDGMQILTGVIEGHFLLDDAAALLHLSVQL